MDKGGWEWGQGHHIPLQEGVISGDQGQGFPKCLDQANSAFLCYEWMLWGGGGQERKLRVRGKMFTGPF